MTRRSTDSGQCPHSDVHYHLNLASFGNTNLRYVELTGHCKICQAPMRFRGPVGMGPQGPGVAADGLEVRLPMMFGTEEFDGNATGYRIRQSDG